MAEPMRTWVGSVALVAVLAAACGSQSGPTGLSAEAGGTTPTTIGELVVMAGMGAGGPDDRGEHDLPLDRTVTVVDCSAIAGRAGSPPYLLPSPPARAGVPTCFMAAPPGTNMADPAYAMLDGFGVLYVPAGMSASEDSMLTIANRGGILFTSDPMTTAEAARHEEMVNPTRDRPGPRNFAWTEVRGYDARVRRPFTNRSTIEWLEPGPADGLMYIHLSGDYSADELVALARSAVRKA